MDRTTDRNNMLNKSILFYSIKTKKQFNNRANPQNVKTLSISNYFEKVKLYFYGKKAILQRTATTVLVLQRGVKPFIFIFLSLDPDPQSD
jgi:hypothetical protein